MPRYTSLQLRINFLYTVNLSVEFIRRLVILYFPSHLLKLRYTLKVQYSKEDGVIRKGDFLVCHDWYIPEPAHLGARGWTFQEKYLSPRTVFQWDFLGPVLPKLHLKACQWN